jgi:hypothetical protein
MNNAVDRSQPHEISHTMLMAGVQVLHLRFHLRAQEALIFGDQPGSALRGAIYSALARDFCSSDALRDTPAHQAVCPVCRLLAAEDDQAGRGRNIPRPLAVEPPLGRLHFPADAELSFGVTLIGWAIAGLPYLIRAVMAAGKSGIGAGRGCYQLVRVSETCPLSGAQRTILEGQVVRRPQLTVSALAVDQAAAAHDADHVHLQLLTPLRLTAGGKLVKRAEPVIFMQRLLERCQNLAEHYAVFDPAAEPIRRQQWMAAYDGVTEVARQAVIAGDETVWMEARSGSRRQNRVTEIGGLVGGVTWTGPLRRLLPWLIWGQSLHVGKDAVKGNGWYQVQTVNPTTHISGKDA